MEPFYAIGIFLFVLFLLLGSGVWIGLALLGVAYVGMEMFTGRPTGDAMMTVIWRSSSSFCSARVSGSGSRCSASPMSGWRCSPAGRQATR